MKRLALVLVLAGCGDNLAAQRELEPASGERLKLEWYLYDDGTRQLEPTAFYDLRLRARCTARTWIDGVLRCVPDADEAVFADAGCTIAIGRLPAIDREREPTHFVGYEHGVPARIYRAGTEDVTAALYFTQQDGVCRGPIPSRRGQRYREIAAELGGEELVELGETVVGEGRLGLRMRATVDGMRAPLGLVDQELGLACSPAGPGETVTCEPREAITAATFGDPACTVPVVIADEPPRVARTFAPDGCAQYHGIGDEIAPIVYGRVGDRCTRVPATRAFALAAPLELATLGRAIEASADRLQRVLLLDETLRFAHDRLYDAATRADCQPRAIGARLYCIPTTVAAVRQLYSTGCSIPVRVTEVAARTCEPPAFALLDTEEGFDIHAIGDRVTRTLYDLTPLGCVPVAPPTTGAFRELGPALPLDTFVGGYAIGDR